MKSRVGVWAGLILVTLAPSLALAQAGACCRTDSTCFAVTASSACANSTVKGYFIPNATCAPELCYPDVIVGDLQDAFRWGSASVGGVTNQIYSFGTYSCNIGTSNVTWQQSTPLHPVIAQDMYRLKSGRIEHIGRAWLKHGFFALSNNICGGNCPYPTNGSTLGVGCSDPYSAQGENGDQPILGPRSIVNPTTGVFPYNSSTWPPYSGTAARRLQVPTTDISDTSALYFIQGHYVTQDDAAAGKGLNNASYRRVSFNTSFTATMRNTTQRTRAVIFAWRDYGGGLDGSGNPIADPTVTIVQSDVPGDGRFYTGAKVTDNGNGTWRYEYAIENLNSDRCASGFSIPLPRWAVVTDASSKSLPYRDGDGYNSFNGGTIRNFDAANWPATQNTATRSLNFALVPASPLENSNAIRYTSLHNYSFTTNVPPTTGSATLTLFKPGTPTTVSADELPVPTVCPCDWNGGGLAPGDIFDFLNAFFSADPGTDIDGNGLREPNDIFAFLNCFFGRSGPCAPVPFARVALKASK